MSAKLTRRAFVATATAAATIASPYIIRAQAQAPAAPAAPPAGPFKQPPLPFAEPQLAPTIGNRTVFLHYNRHHASYYANLNNITKDTKYATMSIEQIVVESAKDTDRRFLNNAGQCWNHELYWNMLKPGGAKAPTGALLAKINEAFGNVDTLKERMSAASGTVFGSGWIWLVQDGGKVELMPTFGGDGPLTSGKNALIGVDLWEHAYYLDYENRRPAHVKAVLDNLINWDYVASRYKA
ncbi:MAG TPA: superoxide dismutase [Xanthobacteraceae bacterium]|jgi:Fe-Mn family superoxide dismutase